MDIIQLIKQGLSKGIKIMIPIYGVKESDARKVKAWKSGEVVDQAVTKFQEENKEEKEKIKGG